MGQKLQRRLESEGHPTDKVVRYAGRYGDIAACDKYKCGYLAMRRLLDEVTEDENYGKNPQFAGLNPPAGKTIAEEFFARLENCIKNRILVVEERLRQQDEYIKLLELELEHYRDRQLEVVEAGIDAVIEACKA